MSGAGEPVASEQLVHALVDGVLVLRAGVVVAASPGGGERIGIGEELTGAPLRDLVHRDDPLPVPGAPTTVLRLGAPDAGYRWFEVTCVETDDGQRLALRDVHARVERERELLTSRRRLLDALDVSLDGFGVYEARRDAEGSVTGFTCLVLNPAGTQSFDRPRREVVGRDILEVFPHCRSSGLWDALLRALETGEPVRNRLEWPGDEETVYAEGVVCRVDADTVVTSWRDVSQSVRQQELLARAYEDSAQVRAALEAALHATSDSFAVYELERDAEGEVRRIVVRLMNTAAAVPLGYEPEQARGRDLLEVFPDLRSCGLWEVIVASVEEKAPRRHRVHIDDAQGAWIASFDNTVAPLGEDQVVVDLARRHRRRAGPARARADAEPGRARRLPRPPHRSAEPVAPRTAPARSARRDDARAQAGGRLLRPRRLQVGQRQPRPPRR